MTELDIETLHEKFLYPTVLVRSKDAGGSGTVLFSRKTDRSGEECATFVLTNAHVVDGSVQYKTEWDNFAKKEIKKEIKSPVDVHFFKYKYQSQQIGTYSVTAQIVAFNKEEDLALLKLDDPNAAKYVAKLYPRDKLNELRIFDKVICVGAGLGHPVFPTHGEITSLMGPEDLIENKQYMMTSAASIFGNCLTGDSLVTMADNKVKRIKEVVKGDRVWSLGQNGLSQVTVEDKIESGIKKIFKVKTRTRTIRASSNHPLLVVDSAKQWNGKVVNYLQWKELKDLKEGDIIAVLKALPERDRGEFNFSQMIGQYKNPQSFMKLLGFFLGDGWTRHRIGQSYEVSLAVYDSLLIEKYAKIIKDLFGYIAKKSMNNNVLSIYSKDVLELFEKCGITGKSTEREIPDWIFTLPRELQISFLEGYIDSDGYVNSNNAWVFEANNEWLVKKLRMLCIHLGINVSNIFVRTRQELTIVGKSTKPSGPSFSFQAYPTYQKNRSSYIGGSKELLSMDVEYETISAVEVDTEEMTYDIKLNTHHNFFADGILVHNSGGALYLKRTQELLGVPSRISVALVGFGGSPISHMSYSIPFTRIYQFLEDNCFHFIYDTNYTESQCESLRKQKEEAQRKYFADTKT